MALINRASARQAIRVEIEGRVGWCLPRRKIDDFVLTGAVTTLRTWFTRTVHSGARQCLKNTRPTLGEQYPGSGRSFEVEPDDVSLIAGVIEGGTSRTARTQFPRAYRVRRRV